VNHFHVRMLRLDALGDKTAVAVFRLLLAAEEASAVNEDFFLNRARNIALVHKIFERLNIGVPVLVFAVELHDLLRRSEGGDNVGCFV